MKTLTKGNYYGKKKQETFVNGIVLSEYDYLIPRTDWHFHENPYFMYLLQGNLYDVNKKGKTVCPSGSFLLHNWQEAHFNAKESREARGFHIEFERQWFDDNKLDIDLWEGSQRIENPELHHLLAKLYFEFKCEDKFSNVTIELLLYQLCEKLNTKNKKALNNEPIWINPLKDLIYDSEEHLTLKFLSQELDVSAVHLSRAIPKYLGTTLGDYLRQQKIKKAIGFMMNPKLSLTDIAYQCNFSDQSHFIKTFRLYFGKTPRSYRKEILGC
ncbi:helix-turn-helix transcriptional regulator [Winogradskyella sp.]|uniref:helix-turn-helix domain-containing protein n=1 Tax=Winogradskyella sp. TaxID=1883156 RepID=UPI0025D9EFFF|nr:helix-turn-helix transcriptional regulator [Winogradskyella sp.]